MPCRSLLPTCLVFEDAPAGLQAGLAAGAAVLAVVGIHQLHDAGPVGSIADFTGLDVTPQPDGSLLVSIARPAARHT